MGDPIQEVLLASLEEASIDYRYGDINIVRFEEALTECGYMIVPIEDPTNLRFGVEE